MGGVDKGLQLFRGRPMAQWAIERFAPQVQELIVNANQNPGEYARFGYRVVPDEQGGFAGPLAGLHAGMKAASHDLIVTVPCDSPFLPLDLVARSVLPHLEAFLASGGRKIDAWYATLIVVEVSFDDEADAFRNINTLQELRDA